MGATDWKKEWRPLLLMVGVFLLSFYLPVGTRRFDGPMGKSDRAFFFGATGLLVGIGLPTSGWLPVLLWIALGLQAWTIVVRARRGLAELAEAAASPPEKS